jgi:UDP-glucose:(heptosyl)LPS alpha-1,3-glucosyltransferase
MKIALVCDRYDPAGGGLEQWLAQLAGRLDRRGHEVHVVGFRFAADAGRARMHALAWSADRLERAAVAARAVANLAPHVTHDTGVGWSYDVLQPQAGSMLANHRRELASLPRGARLRRTFSPAWRRWRRAARELERRQYVGATGLVLAVSGMVAHDLRSRFGVAADRLRVVPNGVDTDRYAPARCVAERAAARARLGADAATPVFLFAARNPRLKGLLPLLRATAILRSGGAPVRVVAIGSAPDPAFRREAARLGVADVVTFAGVVDDPALLYAAADAFVLPTYYDACSLTVLEACACGLPVVTTRHNGAAELMAHGRDGFVLDDPGDARGLAALMAQATAPDVRQRVSLAARELALRNTLDANVDAVENAYFEAIARRSAPAGAAR